MRICSEPSAKIAKYIVPSITDLLKLQRHPKIIPFVIASWLHAMSGTNEFGSSFSIADSSAHLFADFTAKGGADVCLALNVDSVFGDIASQFPQFAIEVQEHFDRLKLHGVRAGIRTVLGK